MIAIIVYEQHQDTGAQVKQYVECDRINYMESKDNWDMQLFRKEEKVFELDGTPVSGVNVYLMENGKTVDRLPRR